MLDAPWHAAVVVEARAEQIGHLDGHALRLRRRLGEPVDDG
jgi:hypothetical protein